MVRVKSLNDLRLNDPARSQSQSLPSAAPSSIADYTFEQYKSANLTIDDQHKVIGQLRSEIPLIDRDEIDNVLLRSMAQQLELAVFPTCNMMQIDPMAVKRMLNWAFWMAYGTKGVRREGEEVGKDKGEEEIVGGKEEGPRKRVKMERMGKVNSA